MQIPEYRRRQRRRPKEIMASLWWCFYLFLVIPGISGSHQTIHLDHLGSYHGLVIGFSNNFSFKPAHVNTTMVSIMNQLQKTSAVLKQMIGVQFADVTLILPSEWHLTDQNLNDLRQTSEFDVRIDPDGQYQTITDADLLYTNDDKNQILTMQFGECGEGGLPINFPIHYAPDERSPRLLAHQWLLYRYGVFNEFGHQDDYNYPVYFSTPGSKSQMRPQVTSCTQGSSPRFIYSVDCNNGTDPITGRPVNPTCNIIPAPGTIESSFVYAPVAVSELHVCNATTHDYQSPTKHNVMCDYQSVEDVIRKHLDFELFKPTEQIRNSSPVPIKFRIIQNRNQMSDETSAKPRVLYALPRHNCQLLKAPMETIKKVDYFPHQAMFGLYNADQILLSSNTWGPMSRLPMIFATAAPPPPLNLTRIFEQITDQFRTSGTVVLFVSGDTKISSTGIDYVERLTDLFNRKSISLRVIIYDQPPGTDVLRFFHQLIGKMSGGRSSVEYAFGSRDSTPAASAFRTQLPSIIKTALFDLLQDLTELTHLLIKRETVRSDDKSGVEFSVDPTMATPTRLLIEMDTNGAASDLAFNFELIDSTRSRVAFDTFELYDKSVMILYNLTHANQYRFRIQSSDMDSFVTITVRALVSKNRFHSYDDAVVTAQCWLQSSPNYPLRGYVRVAHGLNGPVYDADVTFLARSFSKTTGQRNELTFPLNDNGRGNPDITAHDGIYSTYMDAIQSETNGAGTAAAYTIMARIVSHRISVKPGNFGNTVLFSNKPRCCGSELKTTGQDLIIDHRFERLVHCGSFYQSPVDDVHQRSNNGNYAIRDLRILDLDTDNRTVILEWSSPFYARHSNQATIIKAFHSYSEHSTLPREIKDGFERDADREAQIEILTENSTDYLLGFDTTRSMGTANSLRQIGIRVLSPDEGYYLIVVKERNDENESRPSNIVSVYLKSNVPIIENHTALANDQGRLSVGPFRSGADDKPLTWIHILIICIGSALVLFIIVLIIICCTIRRHRSRKQHHHDSQDFKSTTVVDAPKPKTMATEPKSPTSYYLGVATGAHPDAGSLNSNTEGKPHSNNSNSNHTSCSSVNTVDNQQQYSTPNHPATENSILKELNVATLLPNSWDAKELLDHWGRVQEAKMRHQESPPQRHHHHHHHPGNHQSNSPSVLSYGGSSSLDNYNNQPSSTAVPVATSYLCQPALVTGTGYHPGDYHRHQQSPPPPPPPPITAAGVCSPYSNASSIWQHHHQQQQQAKQPGYHLMNPPHGTNANNNYDDNGLPEYSVVRKIMPNISQV